MPAAPKKVRWWNKFAPPSNFLQYLNIYGTLTLATVTCFLAYLTFTNAVEIKGMKDVLSTFKPIVEAEPIGAATRTDSILIKGATRNFGTRPAKDVYVTYCFCAPFRSFYRYDTIDEVLPNIQMNWGWGFKNEVPYNQAGRFVIAIKSVYTDPIMKTTDSSYTFRGNLNDDINTVRLIFISKQREDSIRKEIKTNLPKVNF